MQKQRTLIAMLVGVVTVALLLATAGPIGLTWDEPAYIAASERYVGWFEELVRSPSAAFSDAGIHAHWSVNHEHPPLDKIWSGAVWALTRGVLDDLTAHRLGNMLLAGMLAAAMFYTVSGSHGRFAGIAAVLALLSMPRFFFHAHLAALDVPGAAAYFAVIALFWHVRDRPHVGWDLLLAAAWGTALATKINAAFVLPALGLWALAARRLPGVPALGRAVRRLAVMTLLGPIVFVLPWPWLYHDTAARLEGYIRFVTVDHWQIGQWYLGEYWTPPPWHFAFVMMLAVTPPVLLLLAAAGLWRGLRDARPGAPVVLWSIGAVIPLLALSTGRTVAYDNERLFMPAFPCIAVLAGIGIAALADAVVRWTRAPRLAAAAAAAALALVPQGVAAVHLFPHTLSYYSATVGGLPGAVRLGLEATYWGEVYAAALPLLNAEARPGAIVWVEPWSHDVLLFYQLHGRLRADLRVALAPGVTSILAFKGAAGVQAPIDQADHVLVAARDTGLHVHPQIGAWTSGRTPRLTVERDGVRLMAVYTKEQ